MKIILAGGTGQVGTILARAFHAAGDEVAVLGRRPAPAEWRTVRWDAETLGEWAAELDGADVVVNLAGRSVNCRYTPENRRLILDSRVNATRAIGQAIARAVRPPRVWLQASTATIYAHRYDAANDEATGILGGSERNAPGTWRFSIDVARAWEQEAERPATPHTRRVLMRSAMIMSPDPGGIFDTLLRLVRFGLGGPVAGGRQYVAVTTGSSLVSTTELRLTPDGFYLHVVPAVNVLLVSIESVRSAARSFGSPGLPSRDRRRAVSSPHI